MSNRRFTPFSRTLIAPVALAVLALIAFEAVAPLNAQSGRPRRSPGLAARLKVVNVVAREYAFEMPDTLHAGVTTFRLHDVGREPHHVMLYALDGGHSLRDVHDALAAGGAHPSWMHAVGGPNATIGPRESVATVSLPAGNYAVFCHIPSPDHRIHFSKGMLKALVVLPAAATRDSLPDADVAVTLDDYAFRFSRPLTRGHHRIAITNRGTQTHEMILSRLAPGKTGRDFVHWMEAQDGPPPVQPWGGTTDLAPGRTIVLDVDLEPGTYSLLCRVRDARDGRPHDRHGMMAQVEVR